MKSGWSGYAQVCGSAGWGFESPGAHEQSALRSIGVNGDPVGLLVRRVVALSVYSIVKPKRWGSLANDRTSVASWSSPRLPLEFVVRHCKVEHRLVASNVSRQNGNGSLSENGRLRAPTEGPAPRRRVPADRREGLDPGVLDGARGDRWDDRLVLEIDRLAERAVLRELASLHHESSDLRRLPMIKAPSESASALPHGVGETARWRECSAGAAPSNHGGRPL